MDFAYDQITARSYASGSDRSGSNTPKPSESRKDSTTTSSVETPTPSSPQRQTLQSELQDTLRVLSATPWGTKLGGWWSSAKTQSASYYETARVEAARREQEAAKALEAARKVVVEQAQGVVSVVEDSLDRVVNEERRAAEDEAKRKIAVDRAEKESSPADAVGPTEQETDTLIARFKSTALTSLAEVHKAEDAADEALLRFGNTIRNFLRDTISITAPEQTSNSTNASSSRVLFETTAPGSGKRVIHASRLDAQLHLIHTTPSSFMSDPTDSGEEWEKWRYSTFKIEDRTEQIAQDLEQFPELRETMEALAEEVPYADFWRRYYFLRHIVEERETRRKELLKGEFARYTNKEAENVGISIMLIRRTASATTQDEEVVGWDNDDSDSDSRSDTVLQIAAKAKTERPTSTMTITTQSAPVSHDPSRKSQDEKSLPDSHKSESEASYDLINASSSGAASHAQTTAASSPREKQKNTEPEESEDDDWE